MKITCRILPFVGDASPLGDYTAIFIGVLRSFHFFHAKVGNICLIITPCKALTQYVDRMFNVLPFDLVRRYCSV